MNKKDKIKNELLDYNYKLVKYLDKTKFYKLGSFEYKNNIFLLKLIKIKTFFKNSNLKNLINKEINIANKIGNNNKYLVKYYGKIITRNYIVLKYEYINKGNLYNFKLKYTENNKIFTIEKLLLILKDLIKGIEELKKLSIVHMNINLKNILINDDRLIISGYQNCFFINEKYAHLDLFFYKNFIINEYKFIPPEFLIFNKIFYNSSLYSLGLVLINIISKTKNMKKKLIFQNNNYMKLLDKQDYKNIITKYFNNYNLMILDKFIIILNNLIEPYLKERFKLNIFKKCLYKFLKSLNLNLKTKEIKERKFLFNSFMGNYNKLKNNTLNSIKNISFKSNKMNKTNKIKSKFNFSNKENKIRIKTKNYYSSEKINHYIPKKVKLNYNFFVTLKKKKN